MSQHARTTVRHRLVRRPVAALAALALLLVAALSGCASAVQEAQGGGDGKADTGATLRLGVGTDLIPATPFSNASDGTDALIGLVYDTLVDVPDGSAEPKPALATKWTAGQDGKSLTLDLRKGVTFHDGRELTSKDVAFSVKTWADPSWAVQFQRTAAAVAGFDTSDPHRITLRFAHPLSNIFDLLDVLPIIDSKTAADIKTGKKFVGTGPFEFQKWTPGSEITFTRNDDYWGGKPKLAGVDVKVVPDGQALVSQLRAGQLDAITGGSNRDLESLKKSGKFAVQRLTGAEQQIYVGANVANPLLKDKQVRQAVAYAVDRERITRDVFRGVGYPINLPWPKYSAAYDAELNSFYDRDPAKAKQLIQAATGGKGLTIPLEYDGADANLESTAQIVQSSLADVGIKVDLQPLDHNQFIKKLIGAQFTGLWVARHSYAQWTPSTLAVSAYPFNAEKNASHFDNAAYKADSTAAWQAPDGTGAQAKAAYAKLNKDLLDNAFLIELSVVYRQVASSPRLKAIDWTKRQELRLGKAYLTGS